MTSAASIKVRRPRAVWDRSAPDTRLLPTSLPNTVSLRKPPSGDGRSIDSTRQALLQGNHCRENAPLTGRVFLAGLFLADDSIQPAIGGTRAIAPSHDSTAVSIRELRFNHDGLGSMFPFLKVVERHCWTGMPHTEIFSTFLHILKTVWGRRRVVADVEHPLRRTTGIGAGVAAFLRKSPRPSIAFPSPVAASLVGAFPAPSPVAASLVGAFPASSPVAASLVGALPTAVGSLQLLIRHLPPRQSHPFCHSSLRAGIHSLIRTAQIPQFFPFRRQSIKTATNSINFQSYPIKINHSSSNLRHHTLRRRWLTSGSLTRHFTQMYTQIPSGSVRCSGGKARSWRTP